LNQQHIDSQPFFLHRKDFHKINQLPGSNQKTYSIIFKLCTVHLTKEQMILLSTSLYFCNKEYEMLLVIGDPLNYISDQEVLDSLHFLLSSFNDCE
jgi:hypothetical protein